MNYHIMIKRPSKTILEYIWLGGKYEIRSKTRVIPYFVPFDIKHINNWNYDGSSTWQADSNKDTEIILNPCAVFKDPFRVVEDTACYLVLCNTYDSKNNPTETNHRHDAVKIFNTFNEEEAWFGLEQEYFLFFKNNLKNNAEYKEGYHYCGNADNYLERVIAEKHLKMCLEIGIKISGINAEVCNGQWEFQIGPCQGIEVSDQLIISRYLLERITEEHNAIPVYYPKPFKDINGSGCHINFSTVKSRCELGIDYIYKYIERLEKKHDILSLYGEDNHLRLTGLHETSSFHKFTWGVGTRNTSIRIPNQTFKDQSGYFEDRRPAANIDPYLATSALLKICCEPETSEE